VPGFVRIRGFVRFSQWFVCLVLEGLVVFVPGFSRVFFVPCFLRFSGFCAWFCKAYWFLCQVL